MLTPDQAKAAYAPGSVAVRAGAGTGKTHMLTERYLFHVRQGLSPLEVVAVTFTERAASELRARIRAAVEAADDVAADALFELEAAPIGTIHALAANICRAHPDAADVPADFVILDEIEGGLWLAEHVEDALADLPEAIFEQLPYNQLRSLLEPLLSQPHSAQQALHVGSDGWQALAKQVRDDAKTSLLAAADWQEACAVLEQHQGDDGDKAELARKQALECVRALETGDIKRALELADAINLRGGSKKAWSEAALAEVKAAIRVVRAGLKEQQDALTLELSHADSLLAALLPSLRDAYGQVERHLQTAKRRARVLDFNDLEVCALRALQVDTVRAHYQQRFRAVLVDEVQDTSPIQAAIIEALTEHATVTIVGDEKQSIYGFRGADVQVFESMQQQFVEQGEGVSLAVSLAASFRMHTRLMAHLNAMTAPLLAERHQPLAASRAAPDEGSHMGVYVLTGDDLPNKAFRQVSEARHLAQLIQSLLDAKTPVFDKASQQQRPLSLGDIAILTRTWKPLDTYSDVLPALGVPALHTGGGNLLDTREAKDLLAALTFLADVHHDLALAALLKSPYFALSDIQLSELATATPQGGHWFETLQAHPPEGAAHVVKVLTKLHDLQQQRTEISSSRLLQVLDTLTGYSAVIANLPGAARRVADYRAFIDFVRSLEPGSDTFTVVRRLERLQRAEVVVPRPSLQASDAVTLMTIHRAKGLEFPLVILADLDYSAGNQTPAACIDPAQGVAFKVTDPATGETLEPVLYRHLKRQQQHAERLELRRVLYVGLTRARDRLYLSATKNKGGALELLAASLEAANVNIHEVTFTPDSATYPQAQPASASTTELGDVWRASSTSLDTFAAVASKVALPQKPHTSPWDDVRKLMAMYEEPRWLPLVDVLEHAQLPLPDVDASMLPLTQNGNATLATALLVWQEVALAEQGIPAEDYDQLVILVAEDDPEAVIAPLRKVLTPA